MTGFFKLFFSLVAPRNILAVIRYFWGVPFFLLSKLVPKKNIVVFGARNGKAYDWNSRYIFEYMQALPDCEFKCYWVTRSNEIFKELRQRSMPVLKMFTWRAFRVLLRARWAVISSSITDIDSNLVSGAKVLQTGHGLMVKKIAYGFLDAYDDGKGLERLMYQLYVFAVRMFDRQCKFDYVLAPSENFIYRIMQDYRIGRERIWVTGMPRDDALFEKTKKPSRRIISYLPTHRYHLAGCSNHLKDLFLNYGFDAEKFNRMLEEKDAELILKPHHLHDGLKEVRELFSAYPRLSVYEGDDAIPLLLESDVLISDYSSIFCNYLHLNRPVIFSLFDYETYKSVQSVSDLLDDPPGTVCRSWNQVQDAVVDAFDVDRHEKKRIKMREHLYAFSDGRNCQRIYERMCDFSRAKQNDLGGKG